MRRWRLSASGGGVTDQREGFSFLSLLLSFLFHHTLSE